MKMNIFVENPHGFAADLAAAVEKTQFYIMVALGMMPAYFLCSVLGKLSLRTADMLVAIFFWAISAVYSVFSKKRSKVLFSVITIGVIAIVTLQAVQNIKSVEAVTSIDLALILLVCAGICTYISAKLQTNYLPTALVLGIYAALLSTFVAIYVPTLVG